MRRRVSLLSAALTAMSHALAAEPTLSDEYSPPRDAFRAVEIRPTLDSSEPGRAENVPLDAELLWVMDGDSLRVRIAGEQVEVRLADIDAPEHGQRYAWEAKLALIDIVRNERLTVVPREIDRHGRLVGRVWVRDMEVSRERVNRGSAWFYPAYAKDET